MNYSTPPLRQPFSNSASRTPATPTAANRRLESQRALGGGGASGLRSRGAPVGRVLAAEGVTARSPRRIRKRSWAEKAQDWPSNFLLSLETSLQLLSLDPAGYPAGIALNAIHLLIRLPGLTAAWPAWLGGKSNSRAWTSGLSDADARLAALKRQAKASEGWGWIVTLLSILLVLISLANAVFLFTRKRRYILMLKQDPLSSPNARSTNMDFTPSRSKPSFGALLKQKAKSLIWTDDSDDTEHIFPVQELDVWTPDYVQWSLRLFSLYSPPISLMYHFLTPSNFIPLAVCGGLFMFQTNLLVYYYSNLVSDRATLQSEVMHEYNAKFVNPRVFVLKRDLSTDTADLEAFARPAHPPSGDSRRAAAASRRKSAIQPQWVDDGAYIAAASPPPPPPLASHLGTGRRQSRAPRSPVPDLTEVEPPVSPRESGSMRRRG